jgi:hypothetical protein
MQSRLISRSPLGMVVKWMVVRGPQSPQWQSWTMNGNSSQSCTLTLLGMHWFQGERACIGFKVSVHALVSPCWECPH